MIASQEVKKYMQMVENCSRNVFDFKKIRCPVRLTASWILSKVSDTEIVMHFFGRVYLGRAVKNPFRTDKTPSATFFIGDSGEICLYDFRDKTVKNCFQMVMAAYNVNFDKALTLIAEDFGLIDKSTSIVSQKVMSEAASLDKELRRETLIQFTVSSWERGHGKPLSYWTQYEITEDELKRERVFNIDRLFINKKEVVNTTNEPRFAYVEKVKDGRDLVKIYIPYAKGGQKWYNNFALSQPMGLTQLPGKGNQLVLAKSKKDMILLRRHFPEILSVQNESRGAISADLLDFAKIMYDNVTLIWGADPHALNIAQEVINELGDSYKTWHTPIQDYTRHQIEDPAGYVKMFSFDALTELLKKDNLIN